ncbi:hypothetical protein B0A48_11721 [Cryoendolithus antarcticus]|uniref:Transcription factor domain-containing protein n=1 Tax=Cryoendolithus antarcticus TaxID=1507870 RepID=A0A1V8SSZ0_9PEZI|nr:hypothetical protein B0A48_11721 [Cryoendolithus antarcticus]
MSRNGQLTIASRHKPRSDPRFETRRANSGPVTHLSKVVPSSANRDLSAAKPSGPDARPAGTSSTFCRTHRRFIFGAPEAVCPECPPVEHVHTSAPPRSKSWDPSKSNDTDLQLLTPVSDSSAIDDQAFADFFSTYISPEVGIWRQSYLIALADYAPRTTILQRAKHTLGLAHIASSVGDNQLSRRSRVEYGRILGELRFTMCFPSKIRTRTEFRELVASIALLSHLGDPVVNSINADDSWATHLWAIQHVFSGRVPPANSRDTPLDRGLVRHSFMNGFMLAIAKRKKWVIDARWLPALSQGWTDVLTVFHELPSLLEGVDDALATRGDVSSLLHIVGRLREMRVAALQSPEGDLAEGHQTVDAARLHLGIEEHRVMAASTTFPALHVPDATAEGRQAIAALHWRLLILTMECTLLRIWHFYPEDCFDPISNAWQRGVEQNAYNVARMLCMSALSFTRPDKLVRAIMLRLMITMAHNVFKEQNAAAEADWCRACLEANAARIQRIKDEGGPTLCKVADVLPGIVEACRYKSAFDREAFVVRARETTRLKALTI